MKKLVTFFLLSAICASAFGQATLLFNNRAPAFGVDAPVYDLTLGGTKLEGSSFLAQLWVATTNDPTSYFAVGDIVDFRTGVAAGYVNVGVDGSRTIPSVSYGDYVYAQVRAWTDVFGYSGYDQIATLAYSTLDPAIRFGYSAPVYVQTSTSQLMPPNYMVGLTSFAITAIPEPNTLLLVLLGAVGMFWARSKFRRII